MGIVVINFKERVMNTYDSWLQNYDGYLESLPRADYNIKYDHEEDVYMVFENKMYLESFNTESDAETYIDYLLGE
jgi:hypothetical protein